MSLDWFRLDDKVALVTGAAQGLGYAVAEALAAAGASVVISDRQEDKLTASVSKLVTQGYSVSSLPADVTDSAQVEDLIAYGIETYDAIDILVNNAGGSGNAGVDHIDEISDELWMDIIDINLKSTFLCCRAIVPHMKQRQSGSIINFSSMTAKGAFGPRGTSAARLPYAGAKSGVIGFTTQLCKDVGPDGIRVNAVMPGFILTPPDARVAQRYYDLTEEEQADMVASVPLGRPGRPEEVAAAVLFLASDAASFVTGSILEVSGGR